VGDAPPRDEAELLARCAAGDAAAWEEFVRRYGVLLAALARRMLARALHVVSDADVDEVVADVFLALLRRERVLLKRYDPAYRVSTYLGVICRSEVGRLLRRRGGPARASSLEEERAPVAPGPDPCEQAAAAERGAALVALRKALEELAPRDRLLLTMRFLEGYDYRAIGAALKLSPESVGQLIHRAKQRLAERLPHLRHLVEGS
jgi:RNA polymerase sigma-70 factor, ECF subfamily